MLVTAITDVSAGSMRYIPVTVLLEVLSGGIVGFFGWAFFTFGMLFFWVFQVPAAVYELAVFTLSPLHAEAEVVQVETTGASSNEEHIHRVHYIYSADGRQHRGISYTTDSLQVGVRAPVEYLKSNPSVSRLKYANYSMFGAGVLFILIFPAAGLAMVLSQVRTIARKIALLFRGELAYGRLKNKETTNMTVNNLTVWQYNFVFQDHDGREHLCSVKTHQPESITDQTNEPILYLRNNPNVSYALHALPGAPQSGGMDRINFFLPFQKRQIFVPAMIAINILMGYLAM